MHEPRRGGETDPTAAVRPTARPPAMTRPPASEPAPLEPRALRRVLGVLSTTQIVSWGVLYYAFPVVAPAIGRTTGWSPSMVTGAFSLSLLMAAIAGVPVGRAIDRFGPRWVMTAGSSLAVPAVLAVAWAPSYPAFVAAWLVTGVATSALLYPPAFAALTRWGGRNRVRSITALTLVAGLASTVFAPLTAVLEESFGWRHTYAVLAVVLAVVTIPAHWFGLRHPWAPDRRQHVDRAGVAVRAVWRTPPFLVLLAAMSAMSLCVYAVVINLVPLLTERGLSLREAAVALGLVGVGQVTGRLGYGWFAHHTSIGGRTAVVFSTVVVTTVVLAKLSGPAIVFLMVSVLVGVSRGVFTLIQATAVSDRWGTVRFGHINAIMSTPIMLAAAAAPWAGSALAEVVGSYSAAFLVLAGVAGVAVVITPWTLPRRQPSPE